jgi:deoxyribodipyrimidine photo-lyase
MTHAKENISVFWFRRDLRLNDNKGLWHALTSGKKVLPLFIFDEDILHSLPKDDARVTFIHQLLENMHSILSDNGSGLLVKHGKPIEVWKNLINDYSIEQVFCNEDYEPYGINRDKEIQSLLQKNNIAFHSFQDHVIMHPNEVLKDDGTPFKVYTPYSKKWKNILTSEHLKHYPSENLLDNFYKQNTPFISLNEIGFKQSSISVLPYTISSLTHYKELRDYPAVEATSNVSPHLRFGSVSIRELYKNTQKKSEHYGNELIWREFFMQIMYHYPNVVHQSFNEKYDRIQWRNNEEEFERWCKGETGFPIVDAGMRELNATGYMHNRVRMIVASFLCKDLLIDWRWGEAYFAEKLLDFELSSNNGNWQWAAGTGCDAAPYFRVFNPKMQQEKFDPQGEYIKKWVTNLNELDYPKPMVDHSFARDRALKAYKEVM